MCDTPLRPDPGAAMRTLLFEHDLRANASRLSRGKTGTHPRIKSEGMLFRIMLEPGRFFFSAVGGIRRATGLTDGDWRGIDGARH